MPVTESLSTAVLVKETRKRLGLTQVQFAKTLGVSFQSVNRWERGKTKPLPIVLKQIELMVKEMGDRAQDLLIGYFASKREKENCETRHELEQETDRR
jgi:DNA-binding XRE family transcriptional regulator